MSPVPQKKRKIYLKMVFISFICLVDWFHVRTLPESPKEKQRNWPLGKQKNEDRTFMNQRVRWRTNECSKPNLQLMWVVVTDKQNLIDYLICQPFNAVNSRVSTALNTVVFCTVDHHLGCELKCSWWQYSNRMTAPSNCQVRYSVQPYSLNVGYLNPSLSSQIAAK